MFQEVAPSLAGYWHFLAVWNPTSCNPVHPDHETESRDLPRVTQLVSDRQQENLQ